MKVQNNITVFSGDTRNNAQLGKTENGSAREENSKTFYAGNLMNEFSLRDRIQQKKAQAQERALKIVGDAWDGDKKLDQESAGSKERLKNLKAEYKEAQDSLRDINEKKDELMKAYDIDPDSQEQKDLELLRKAGSVGLPWSEGELTAEEEERLAQIQGKELTEYQSRVLELDKAARTHQINAFTAEKKIEQENAVIRGIREERRKTHTIVDAQKQAEEVRKAASEEVIGMVMEETKEHIDQEQEEKEEQAEEIKEKKEEQEEILEKRKENEKELEELMEDMPLEEMADLENAQTEIQQEIQNIVNKMNLVVEDIKGAKIDSLL